MKKKIDYERWITDLESGKFHQCHGRLERHGCYCVLGVLCLTQGEVKRCKITNVLEGISQASHGLETPIKIDLNLVKDSPLNNVQRYKFESNLGNNMYRSGQVSVMNLNDSLRLSFEQIATLLRLQLEVNRVKS